MHNFAPPHFLVIQAWALSVAKVSPLASRCLRPQSRSGDFSSPQPFYFVTSSCIPTSLLNNANACRHPSSFVPLSTSLSWSVARPRVIDKRGRVCHSQVRENDRRVCDELMSRAFPSDTRLLSADIDLFFSDANECSGRRSRASLILLIRG